MSAQQKDELIGRYLSLDARAQRILSNAARDPDEARAASVIMAYVGTHDRTLVRAFISWLRARYAPNATD